ncbi:DUF1445 domain-containing protein [Glycomyces sp. TRM65418]|uniref:D-glutamate cyclase family protein n=1 Tax=Glycomyces sp. TRM65418 TaxID=2867006 RepID=UPI001CE650ED|nr:DUF1445 domain-containing protein [Glycomyces sp. TRM65418]MCC3762302.1 DUF1445 domain-containing protein [Glycomyces sp. TRM65418]QZD56356.1 DUF1445 domain-containing protein [Glycomyces sp. TRM65418]
MGRLGPHPSLDRSRFPVRVDRQGRVDLPGLAEAFGDRVAFADVPVSEACGMTLQETVVRAKPPVASTHPPGHVLTADRRALRRRR